MITCVGLKNRLKRRADFRGVYKTLKLWYNYSKYHAEDRCRFCSHFAWMHIEIRNFGADNMQAKWDQCDKKKCKCPGFGPVDNLQYLEERSEHE